VVFTTPLVSALRSRFPHAHLAYLVEPLAAPVVAGHPDLNEVIIAPRRTGMAGVRADLTLTRQIRARRFDLVIDCHGGPRASLLTWLSGAPRRIGYDVIARGWMYTDRVRRARVLLPRHSVESQWDLLSPLGITPASRDAWPVRMTVPPGVGEALTSRLDAAGVQPDDALVVMHVSAGNPFRRWPLLSFARVAAALLATGRRRVIITSGPSERDAASTVIAAAREQLAPSRRDRVVEIGELSLTDLRALADRAALYVGGDSGPLHIAATSTVPIVALFGPTLPARSMPWRAGTSVAIAVEPPPLACRPCEQRICVHGDFRCLRDISPDDVLIAAERALGAQP
jgi:ADP-heptose:LPS heptosyltransferase